MKQSQVTVIGQGGKQGIWKKNLNGDPDYTLLAAKTIYKCTVVPLLVYKATLGTLTTIIQFVLFNNGFIRGMAIEWLLNTERFLLSILPQVHWSHPVPNTIGVFTDKA